MIRVESGVVHDIEAGEVDAPREDSVAAGPSTEKKEQRKNGLINEDNNNINQQWKLRGQPPTDDHDDCVEVEEDLQEDSKDDYRVWCSPSSSAQEEQEDSASLSETTVDNTCE